MSRTVVSWSQCSVNFTPSYSTTICSGVPVHFEANTSLSGTPPFTFLWCFSDGFTSAARSFDHSFSSLGCGNKKFYDTLRVTDANGCVSTRIDSILIKQEPGVVLQDSFKYCNRTTPYTLTLNNLSANPTCVDSYTIDWGDPLQPGPVNYTALPVSHTYTSTGEFSLVVTALGANGCSSSKTALVFIQSNPSSGIEGPKEGGTVGCGPIGFWFYLKNYKSHSLGTRYIWNFGDGSDLITWKRDTLTVDSIFHTFDTTSCKSPNQQFFVKVTAQNGCLATDATVNGIQVFKKPKANFSAPVSACVNTPVSFSNITDAAYNDDCSRNTSYVWHFGDGSVSSSVSPTHTFQSVGNFSDTLIATGYCGNDTMIKQISIEALPTIAPPSPAAVCPGSVIGPLLTTTSGSSFSWTNSNTAIGLGNSGSTNPIPAFTAANNTALPLSANITVKAFNGGCPNQANFTITINPRPVIPNRTATICSGTAFTITPANNPPGTVVPTGTSYTWGLPVSSPAGAITGGAAQPVAQTSISQTLTNITTSPATLTYTVVPVSGAAGNCVGNPFTVTITVTPKPLIPDQITSICSGGTFALTPSDNPPSAIVPAGTAYSWSAPVGNGITGGAAGTNQPSIRGTLANNTNTPQKAVYTITPIASGSCNGNSFKVEVTVNPKPVIPNQTANICSGAAFSVTPVNGSPTSATIVPMGTVFTWTTPVSNPAGLVTGGSAQSSPQTSIGQTLINNSPNLATLTYTVTPVSGDDGSCIGNPFTVTVTVNPQSAIPKQTVVVCSGSPFNVTPAGAPASVAYTWTDPLSSPAGAVTGGSAQSVPQPSISQTLINRTNAPATVTYTVTPSSACANGTFPVEVTVNPKAVISDQAISICSGGTFAFTASNNPLDIVPASTLYTWSTPVSNPVGVITGGSAQPSPQASIGQTLTNSSANPATLLYTVSPISPGQCIGNSFTIAVSVNAIPSPPAVTSPVNYCQYDQAKPLSATPDQGNTLLWYVGTTGNGTPTAPTPLTSAVGNTKYYVSQINTAAGCEGRTRLIDVNVIGKPHIDSANYINASSCTSSTGAITLYGLMADTSYVISYKKDGVAVTAILPSTSSGTLVIPKLASGTYDNIAASLYVPLVTLNGCGSNTVGPFTLENDDLPPPGITSPVTYCKNDPASPLTASGKQGNTLNWYSAPAGGAGTPVPPTPVTTNVGVTYYYVSQKNSTGCEGGRSTIAVFVHARPAVSILGDTVKCVKEPALFLSSIQTADPLSSYKWLLSNGASGSAPSFPYTFTVPGTYTVKLLAGTDKGCFDSSVLTVQIRPSPSVNIGPDTTLPAGSSYTFHPVIQNGPVSSWTWSPSTNLDCINCTSPTARIQKSITYYLTVQNNYGCTASDTMNIKVLCNGSQVFIPKAFSPDGDGINDVFMVRGGLVIDDFIVYNRWGQIVYEIHNNKPTDEPAFGWNGMFNKKIIQDVYSYVAIVHCAASNQKVTYRGLVTLILAR